MNKFFGAVIGAIAAILVFSLSPKSDSYIRDRVVKLTGNGYTCTGEQVTAPSGRDYVLTAAHCMSTAEGGFITATTESGETYRLEIIEEDPASDLLLLRGVPDLTGLDIAHAAPRFSRVRTFTHGAGNPTYETDGFLIGKQSIKALVDMIETPEQLAKCEEFPAKNTVLRAGDQAACIMDVEEEVTSAMIVPGSSGGPVVNASGDLVGVVSTGDGHFGGLVTMNDIHRFLKSR
jgi:hypothetical protein